jgi:hypothetical protein
MKPRLPNRIAIPIIAAAGIALTAALALASAATAQTLNDPRPSPKWPPPPKTEKAHAAARVKTCAAYGAGFVQVPDTGTCIKVGGFVESTVSGGH